MSQTHFDTIAEEYDESLPAHVVEHYLRKRVTYLSSQCPPGGEVLDLGCGTGALASRMSQAGFHVTGIDPSAGMLEVLEERAPAVDAVVGSGTALPFADDRFDLVYCVAVMHHIADRDGVRATLAEMVRVAKPGAAVVIWDHNPRNPYWRLLMKRVPQDTGEERLIPANEVVAGLTAAGARTVGAAQLGMVPDFTPRMLLSSAARAERLAEGVPGVRRFCAHNVIRAQKAPPAE